MSTEHDPVSALARRAGFSAALLACLLVLVAVPGAHAAAPECPGEAFRTGLSAQLPDCRAYELVSPADLNGAKISSLNREGGPAQAAANGAAITYATSTPVGSGTVGNRSPEWEPILSTRSSGGWSSLNMTPPNESVSGVVVNGNLSQYLFFSSNLSTALVVPGGETPLSPGAPPRSFYLHADAPLSPESAEAPAYAEAAAGGGYLPVGVENLENATPDLTHVVFRSLQALTANAIAGNENLYEWAGGELQLVSILPDEEATSGVLGLLNLQNSLHAISADGSRIVWTRRASGHTQLYLRDMARGETVLLSAVQEGVADAGLEDPRFRTASSDGSKVFFTDTQQLTADSGATQVPESPDLYECEILEAEGELKCRLSDLTPESAGEPGGALGQPAVSEDGSYVYFAANGVLTHTPNARGESASPGQCNTAHPPPGATCNLYLSHEGVTTFIAALSNDDAPDWTGSEGNADNALWHMTSRVSPDGRYLAFMSDRSLTGYDNADASSGAADEEVFLYDAAADNGEGKLICASCNPTGAQPHGVLDTDISEGGRLLVDEPEVWIAQSEAKDRWLAANVPGWTAINEDLAPYQSRYLSNSGRLFFNSSDRLVPRDTNGKEDVYEYEPEGVGGCTASSETFSAETEGCIDLISSGTSAEESAFLDASENGDDVFFLSAAQLTPQGSDSKLDLYDAHRCTDTAPCLAPAPAPAPPCTSPAACREAAPAAPLLQTPTSSTVIGPGNEHPKPKKPKKQHHKKPKKHHKKHHQAKGKRAAGHNRGGAK